MNRTGSERPGATDTCAHSATARLRDTNPLDLPLERDAAVCLHAPPYFLTQFLNIRRRGIPPVDQEVAVQFRDLRVADHERAAARGIDQLPGFVIRADS